MERRGEQTRSLQQIAERAYATLASAYPVCCSSDEFYFFPQVLLDDRDWSSWDDFSAVRIAEVETALKGHEAELVALGPFGQTETEKVDAGLLLQVLKTAREQLTEFSSHRTQPTFHLTILAAGLAEAISSDNRLAWTQRVAGLPQFLRRATSLMEHVPELFRQLGLEMLHDLQTWTDQLRSAGYAVGGASEALAGFGESLKRLETIESCRLPEAQFDKLVDEHFNCGMTIDSVRSILDDEFREMEELLQAEASRLVSGSSWVDAVKQVPFIAAHGEQLLDLYRHELAGSSAHCRRVGLVPDEWPEHDGLSLSPVPAYLAAVRASDAYNATPGFPPRGGVFYVMEEGRSRNGIPGRSLEYRMTAAHETWPGHHLLDYARWNLDRPLRRPVELPLFYEGWACLAEELMAQTGYFEGPWDRYLLAKRRIERAARGLIDVGLQTGRMEREAAVALLLRVGYAPDHARSAVSKYLLRPGYQVCYTLGLRRGLDLLETYGRKDIGRFVRTVLRQGEVGFDRLEKILALELAN